MSHSTPAVAVQDLPETARRLLWTVSEWYCGTEIDDRHIATHRPSKFTRRYRPAADAVRETVETLLSRESLF